MNMVSINLSIYPYGMLAINLNSLEIKQNAKQLGNIQPKTYLSLQIGTVSLTKLLYLLRLCFLLTIHKKQNLVMENLELAFLRQLLFLPPNNFIH